MKFVEAESNLLNAYPEQNQFVQRNEDKRPVARTGNRKATCASITVKEVSNSRLKCYYCEQRHIITKCESFLGLTLKQHREFLNSKNRCFNCFGRHATRECHRTHSYKVQNCKGHHHTLMHNHNPINRDNAKLKVDQTAEQFQAEHSSNANVHSVNSHSQKCYFNIVPLKISSGQKEIYSYPFLELGSDTTFCHKRLIKVLDLAGEPRRVALDTSGQHQEIYTGSSVSLTITSLDDTATFNIPNVVTRDSLPVTPNGALTERDLRLLRYL